MLGTLDDLLIVPLGIMLAVRLVPPALMAEFRAAASARGGQTVSRAGLLAIVAIWLILAAVLLSMAWRSLAAA